MPSVEAPCLSYDDSDNMGAATLTTAPGPNPATRTVELDDTATQPRRLNNFSLKMHRLIKLPRFSPTSHHSAAVLRTIPEHPVKLPAAPAMSLDARLRLTRLGHAAAAATRSQRVAKLQSDY